MNAATWKNLAAAMGAVAWLCATSAEVAAAPTGMVEIPAGAYVMGATTNVGHEGDIWETPQHTVNVSAFYVDIQEVTLQLWNQVKAHADTHGYGFANPGDGKGQTHPVHSVNWYDAVKWCNARSEMEGLTPVYYGDVAFAAVYRTNELAPVAKWEADGYRLPTEAEWEKAARGGVPDHRFPWSDTDFITHAKANYYAGTGWPGDVNPTEGYHPTYMVDPRPYTSPAGSFPANDYGLYDMAGNVYEWCWDWSYRDYYSISPTNNPRGYVTGSQRMARGGSWGHYSPRVAYRLGGTNPQNADNRRGFRTVRRAGLWDEGYTDIGNGWRRLGWFGDYSVMGGGWIWHNRHGFFCVAEASAPGDSWLYSMDMGWLWTSNATYPFLYRASDGAWLWYNGATNPRWFRNMTAGTWEHRP